MKISSKQIFSILFPTIHHAIRFPVSVQLTFLHLLLHRSFHKSRSPSSRCQMELTDLLSDWWGMDLHLFVRQTLHVLHTSLVINTLRPRQNGRQFADDTCKCIFLNENVSISIKISLKFIPKGPIDNIPALVQIMAWRRLGDKPLYETMLVSLLTHICVTRPQLS